MMMNKAIPGSFALVSRRLGGMAALVMMAGCTSENPRFAGPHGGPGSIAGDTVVVVPDYKDSPGPHPTKVIVSSTHTTISRSDVTVAQNGSGSVIITVNPQAAYIPTASVSPAP